MVSEIQLFNNARRTKQKGNVGGKCLSVSLQPETCSRPNECESKDTV